MDCREEARRIHSQYLHRTLDGRRRDDPNRSDHLATVLAYNDWLKIYLSGGNQAAYQFSRENFLSHVKMLEIKSLREHFREYLIRAGFIGGHKKGHFVSGSDNFWEEEDEIDAILDDDDDEGGVGKMAAVSMEEMMQEDLVRCALCAGFFPNVIRAISVQVDAKKEAIKMVQSDGLEVFLHPSSLLSR